MYVEYDYLCISFANVTTPGFQRKNTASSPRAASATQAGIAVQSPPPIKSSNTGGQGIKKGLASSRWAQSEEPAVDQSTFQKAEKTQTAPQATGGLFSVRSATPGTGFDRPFVRGLTSSLFATRPAAFAGCFTGEH